MERTRKPNIYRHMVDFFCRQEKTFGLGNFINCTPTLMALSKRCGMPIPVYFETIGEAFTNCPFIRHLDKPEGTELFGSYTINSTMPDWEFIFRFVEGALKQRLGEIPGSYIDSVHDSLLQDQEYYVILRGCFSNIPHKVSAKDPGDDIYIEIIRYLEQRSNIQPYFIGTYDDYLRNDFVNKVIGKRLKWPKTSIRDALAYVNDAKFVIGNDTGLMHAASALNKKAFCMWQKTNFKKNQARNKIDYSLNSHFVNFQRWISGLL